MMKLKHLLFIFIFLTSFFCRDLQAKSSQKDFIIQINPVAPHGMFAIFNNIAGFLFLYELGYYAGLKVDFKNKGLYHDPEYGDNWWTYYFDPIEVGSLKNAKVIKADGTQCIDRTFLVKNGLKPPEDVYYSSVYPGTLPEHFLSRQQLFEIIEKYIKIKPHIEEKVKKFIKKNFKDEVIIGIHYRGTDKIAEAPRVSYHKVLACIDAYLEDNDIQNYKIFVATDEQKFLELMQANFPHRVIHQKAVRSNTEIPLHLAALNPYQQGEEALIDCLLLSKCHALIRTSSNLSLWASFFNPALPVVLISPETGFN